MFGEAGFARAHAQVLDHDVVGMDVDAAAVPFVDGSVLNSRPFRVAINAITDYRKKASTRREKSGKGGDELNLAARGTPDVLATEELVALLRNCVEQLPEPFRLVVQAKLAGESSDETAGRLSISRATVDTRYHRARERLAACSGAEQP